MGLGRVGECRREKVARRGSGVHVPRGQGILYSAQVPRLRKGIQALYDAGCSKWYTIVFWNYRLTVLVGNIQFDDPLLAYFCAESMIQGMEERGVDHAALLNTYVKAYNDLLKFKPKDMTAGLHLCRGNFRVSGFPQDVTPHSDDCTGWQAFQ